MARHSFIGLGTLVLLVGWSSAEEPSNKPDNIPVMRWDMKKALEAQKAVKPRLPAPEVSEEMKAKGRTGAGQGGMRALLDPEIKANWPRDWLDTNMPLTREMRNELLWITSRVNNCLY